MGEKNIYVVQNSFFKILKKYNDIFIRSFVIYLFSFKLISYSNQLRHIYSFLLFLPE